jgi:hypothetical protein
VFATIIQFIDNRFVSIMNDPHGRGGGLLINIYYTFVYVFFYGILPEVLIFTIPFMLVFKLKQPLIFAGAVLLLIWIDYLNYGYFGGFANALEKFYFVLVDVLCFLLLFNKATRNKFSKTGSTNV